MTVPPAPTWRYTPESSASGSISSLVSHNCPGIVFNSSNALLKSLTSMVLCTSFSDEMFFGFRRLFDIIIAFYNSKNNSIYANNNSILELLTRQEHLD